MKICVVSYKFGTPEEIGTHLGVYSYLVSELKILNQKVEKITVVSPGLTLANKGSTSVEEVEVIRTFSKMLDSWKWLFIKRLFKQLYIYTTYKKLLKLHQKEKFDLIYVWQARESCIAALNFKKKTKVPVVFHQIGPWHWHLNKLNQPGFKNFLKRTVADAKNQQKYIDRIYQETDKLIFPSKALETELNNVGYKVQAEVIPLAVEHQVFKPSLDVSGLRQKLGLENKRVLIFIGRIIFQEKGLDYLLKAVETLKNQGQKDFKLIIIGGGETSEINQLQAQIEKSGISEFVEYLGKVPNDNLPAYLNLADISLVPSIWFEILGRVIIEAMSCGTPVICSDLGGMPEVNINNATGLTVPAKDSEALATAIKKLLDDDSLREQLGQAGRQRVENYYTYEKVADQFINIFQQVIHNG